MLFVNELITSNSTRSSVNSCIQEANVIILFSLTACKSQGWNSTESVSTCSLQIQEEDTPQPPRSLDNRSYLGVIMNDTLTFKKPKHH